MSCAGGRGDHEAKLSPQRGNQTAIYRVEGKERREERAESDSETEEGGAKAGCVVVLAIHDRNIVVSLTIRIACLLV